MIGNKITSKRKSYINKRKIKNLLRQKTNLVEIKINLIDLNVHMCPRTSTPVGVRDKTDLVILSEQYINLTSSAWFDDT